MANTTAKPETCGGCRWWTHVADGFGWCGSQSHACEASGDSTMRDHYCDCYHPRDKEATS